MRRLILITLLLACIPILCTGYKIWEYYDYKNTINDKEMKVNGKIEKIDLDILKKKNDIEQLKFNNSDKVEILELWKKRLEKIK